MDHLVDAGALQPRTDEGELALGPEAQSTFAGLGVEIPAKDPRRMLAYSCMDSLAADPTSVASSEPTWPPPCATKAGSDRHSTPAAQSSPKSDALP
jgi:hypothetical protein